MNYLSTQVLEREMNYFSVKCWVYVCGGLFGSAVDKKNEKKDYLSVKCWVYTGVCMWHWLVWLSSEQTSQTSQLV